jgi:hypothetical protein
MKTPSQKEAWLIKIVQSNTYNGVIYILLVAKRLACKRRVYTPVDKRRSYSTSGVSVS